MPARLEIVGHALQRLVRLADQNLFFRRAFAISVCCSRSTGSARQPPRMFLDQPVDAVQESRRAFDSLLAPFQVFFRRRGEERVHPPRVAAVFVGHLDCADDVALRLRHLHAVFQHHALREQALDRLAMVHQPEVAHHLAEKARIDQVQDRVLHAADVLIDRQPVARPSPYRTARDRCAGRCSGRNTTTNRRTCPSCRSRAAPGRRISGTSCSRIPARSPAAIALAP